MARNQVPKSPLRPAGIVFAFALNLLLPSLVFVLLGGGQTSADPLTVPALALSLVAGLATTFYVRARSGIHAFIGGLLSAPVLALFVIPGNWRLALLCGSLCALGGILGELYLRRQSKP